MILPPLSSYSEFRSEFLRLAEAAGGAMSSFGHPELGMHGEELATDVARFGPPPGEAETVVIIQSGVHGVEGYMGSGVQRLLLGDGSFTPPPKTAVVFVHAVNPYGFSWSRRVDHENVDVNRNFVDFANPPANVHYAEVDHILNPSEPIDPADRSYLEQLQSHQDRLGAGLLYRTISGGQYTHPEGVQFGGTRPTWSHRTIRRIWELHVPGARNVVVQDLHTGLGAYGQLIAFFGGRDGSREAELGEAWYPEWKWRTNPEETFDSGPMPYGMAKLWNPEGVQLWFGLEYGTHDPTRGLTAMRADNWLFEHGDPFDERGVAIRELMETQFFSQDEAWRTTVATTALEAIGRSLDAIAEGQLD